ncbi:hypothetical protein [Leptothrix ochracea]|uniref:hypothetical protein n=1 Tax=Leptothrix ochracea TaxID=735331 RepID=UPI0034E2A24F
MSSSEKVTTTDADVKVAWLLCTELSTRITTQPLPLRDGDEATALQSVADFFRLARSKIAENPGCVQCAPLVLNTLNEKVRPFTAHWHRIKAQNRMQSADVRYRFRAELEVLRKELIGLAQALASIASMPMPLIASQQDGPSNAEMTKGALPFGLPNEPNESDVEHMNQRERQEVDLRRARGQLPRSDVDAVGLALSGGGIRSATFALGVLQPLAQRDLLKEVDFMSTVSGGGYLGSFISTHGMDALKPSASGIDEPPIRHMRNHSRYLIEGGLSTLWTLLWVLVSGILMSGLCVVVGWLPPYTGALHRYYRHRLARTFIQNDRPMPLAELNGSGVIAPYHLINTALNVPSSEKADLRDRQSTHFVLSKHYCGSTLTGWQSTADLDIDLATAMAISGAAASPHMGTQSRLHYRVLMTLLGLRLGCWLRWPKNPGRWWKPNGLLCFLRELSGRGMDEKQHYLNLSDGGHIENLGVYELLRRRCRFIIAIDGECDPEHHFGGLLTLTRMAQIDLGVRIEPDLSDLRPNAQGVCNNHFVMAHIAYPGTEVRGLLLYIKLSMTGNESEFLRNYRREFPDFPHQSTAQQLYSETQFEAYRALGEHVGNELFADHLMGHFPSENCTVSTWMGQLAHKLL